MRISPGKCPNQLSLSAASQSMKPTTVKSTPILTSNLPRFSMVKPHCTPVLWHEYGLRRTGCQELRRPRTPSSPGTSLPVGETIGPRSVVRLSALCTTATMADRFHVMGMKELLWTILQLPQKSARRKRKLNCNAYGPNWRVWGERRNNQQDGRHISPCHHSIQRLSPPMELCTGRGRTPYLMLSCSAGHDVSRWGPLCLVGSRRLSLRMLPSPSTPWRRHCSSWPAPG